MEFNLNVTEDVQEGDKKDVLDVLFECALKYEHVSAVESTLDGLSKGLN